MQIVSFLKMSFMTVCVRRQKLIGFGKVPQSFFYLIFEISKEKRCLEFFLHSRTKKSFNLIERNSNI